MEWWVVVAIAGVVLAAGWLAISRGWIDLSDKRRRSGSGGGVFGIGDEVFAPRKYEAQAELDRQALLPAPAPLPGDGDKGIAFADEHEDAADELALEPPRSRAAARADRFRGSIRLDV